MKKSITIAILAILFAAAIVIAGEIRTTPQYIVLTAPTTNTVELISQEFFYGDSPYLIIRYNIRDAGNNIRASHELRIDEAAFTAFVSGIGATLYSRGDAAVWADIQAKYDIQAVP